MSQKYKVIDGHAHACGEYLTAENIKKKLEATNVDCVLLTPGQYGSKMTYGLKNAAERNPLGDVVSPNNRTTSFMIGLIGAIREIPKGNEYVFQLKQILPENVKQCYWVTRKNWELVPGDYARMQFDTIKFHQCWEKFEFEDEFFIHTMEWATKKRIPVFLHVRDLEQMKKLIVFIQKHPDTIIIIGHLYGVELFMQADKKYFENIFFDLSNFYFVSKERTMLAYKHFGSEHLLMGSDTPYGKQSLEKTIQQIESLEIPMQDKQNIMGMNLMRLLEHA